MSQSIFYKASVSKDMKRIDHPHRVRILNAIEKELALDPEAGKPLQGNYKGLLSLRVGDYRVVYTQLHDGILVLRISHRKDVYRE